MRIALGALREQVLWKVVRESLLIVMVGFAGTTVGARNRASVTVTVVQDEPLRIRRVLGRSGGNAAAGCGRGVCSGTVRGKRRPVKALRCE